MMGGGIWVNSQVGQGSTFRFTLCFGPAEASLPVQPLSRAQLAGVRVLVIDDNEINRSILAETLAHWGMVVTLAESGAQGIATLQAPPTTRCN
jgi:hypothetical protein